MNKLAIMMRINLIGEDLNNEGTIGNVIQPRQIELPNGEIRQAISGEMLKHYHSRNLRLLADESELCDTCKIFSPMKNGTILEKDSKLSASGNKVKQCIVDDIEGFMNAGKGANEKRTSCIKFSWAIATQENEYSEMLHTRVDPTQSNNKKKRDKSKDYDDANTNKDQNTQMLFHRPLRSNEYAITIQVDLDRIAFDDEKLTYTLSEDKTKERQIKCIKALKNMFIDMEGALCSTRLPHICGIEGVIVKKQDKNSVLCKYSALQDDYKEVNDKIADDSVIFNNIEEFADIMENLI
ncbi:DevR family CRISPR-associated autoregulator [Clostridium butyricum]|uniref:DevR family CRISPR-associated autoregulator n=1 Tax=Clostridium butyricum TaxID=1492 RepID=UPI0034672F08